jgi:hypothetical protein
MLEGVIITASIATRPGEMTQRCVVFFGDFVLAVGKIQSVLIACSLLMLVALYLTSPPGSKSSAAGLLMNRTPHRRSRFFEQTLLQRHLGQQLLQLLSLRPQAVTEGR